MKKDARAEALDREVNGGAARMPHPEIVSAGAVGGQSDYRWSNKVR